MELPRQQHRHHRKQNNLCTEKSRAHRANICVLQGRDKFCFCLQGGVTALSPPVSATGSAKGPAGRAKPCPGMLRFGGVTVVKGRKVIPCMESPVQRFGSGNVPVKALGLTARWCWGQGTSKNKKHGESFMFFYGGFRLILQELIRPPCPGTNQSSPFLFVLTFGEQSQDQNAPTALSFCRIRSCMGNILTPEFHP